VGLSLALTAVAAAQPSVVGQWASPVTTGTIAIHSSLMHNGNVLFWTYSLKRGIGPTIAKVVNTTTGVVTDVTPTFNADFYCGGITFLQNGKLFVTGGQNEYGVVRGGVTNTEIFDPTTNTWTQGPAMNYGRWYPTNFEMSDGTVLISSGFDSGGVTNVHPMELYNPTYQTITVLPTTANTPTLTDTYPRLHLLPNGLIFNSGQRADTQMYDPVAQDWYFVSNSKFGTRQEGTSVLLPGLWKVLAAGGTLTENAGGATNTAEVIDLSQASPQWAYTGSMTYARYNHNVVLLADGTVLAVGGNTQGIYDSPVYAAELYNPNTGTWTVMASQQGSRGHHGTALLLPDGTVYSAGSDNGTSLDDTYEIYSPPYLFTGTTRPVISSTPKSVNYGQTFTIGTQQAKNITRVALIKPGADTHDNNMDQRYVDLTWTVGTNQLTATAPPSAAYAPPGYYMVVIVDNNGVPSVMPFMQLMPTYVPPKH
jgi:hypothetical protein